ncbi:hypothetical protein D4764_0192320 [Takifugu flavidus]|uniref:Immunoglobulin V-set domain-containing protein n=1 Tax=Takifugu flavidus TaxID=433684 RepID=A0A5C6MH36_9TELE|nr:hypothetical protein D4764_0192320 [Takifugu flavidus]
MYSHTGGNKQCERKTNTCFYSFSMKNLNTSQTGTYYCAVAARGHILFGNGTKLVCGAAVDEMEGQDQQSMSAGKEEKNVPSAPPSHGEGGQAMYPVLTGGNIVVAGGELHLGAVGGSRAPEEGGQGDGWLAAQRSMIEEQQKQQGVVDEMIRRIVRIENMLVKARDEGGAKARKKRRRRRKDEEETGPQHIWGNPTGRGHESIRNSSPSHPGRWTRNQVTSGGSCGRTVPLVASQSGAAPWIAAFKALTMGVPLALGDVRMVVAACVGLEKLAGVEQLAGTSVQGGNRAPDTTPFADHIGAFCDALRLHFPISVAAIEDFSHHWKDDGSIPPEQQEKPDLIGEEYLLLKVLKRKWQEPNWTAPHRVTARTDTAVQFEGKGDTWYHLSQCAKVPKTADGKGEQ